VVVHLMLISLMSSVAVLLLKSLPFRNACSLVVHVLLAEHM
jgi:hypothetical protein